MVAEEGAVIGEEQVAQAEKYTIKHKIFQQERSLQLLLEQEEIAQFTHTLLKVELTEDRELEVPAMVLMVLLEE